MSDAVSELEALVAGMRPQLFERPYAFARAEGDDVVEAFAVVREDEGVTAILEAATARTAGLEIAMTAARITLRVHSALEAVGLTAAVASALARCDIPCNVVAGVFHDHLFVPWAQRDAAMACLRELQGR